MGWDSAGYEIGNVLARGTFPAARLKRQGPPPSSGPEEDLSAPVGSQLGRPRVFPFAIKETAARRNTISTPKLLGNVLIQSLFFSSGSHADPPNDTLEVGYALQPITETNVLLTEPRPYTVLTELLDPHGIIANDRGQGFFGTTLNVPNRGGRIPLGLYILERECSVVLGLVNPSAFVQTWLGYINVIENLSSAQLARALGAP